MATVREGVMKLEPQAVKNNPVKKKIDVSLKPMDEVVVILCHIEPPKVNLKAAQIMVAGGYGMEVKKLSNSLRISRFVRAE